MLRSRPLAAALEAQKALDRHREFFAPHLDPAAEAFGTLQPALDALPFLSAGHADWCRSR
jgi:hypothetical protein